MKLAPSYLKGAKPRAHTSYLTMRQYFPYRLYSQQLYCRQCRQAVRHDICAMEEYSTYGGLDRGIPLLCVCTHCGTIHVAFSQEFAFGRKDEAHSEYAKVYGHNRIFPGDWLYFDGATRPCIVKSFFQSRDREVVVYKRNGMPDEKYEGPKIPISHEVAPEGYRLLPAQCVNTLLGDHVYHVLRKQFGVAVGVVKDDTKDKLVVKMDDGLLVFMSYPRYAENPPNDEVVSVVRKRLEILSSGLSEDITIEAGQGIVYLRGFVNSLATKRAIQTTVGEIMGLRGCVNMVRVRKNSKMTDGDLERRIWDVLDDVAHPIFKYSVKVKSGAAKVTFYYEDEVYPEELKARIESIPGIVSLNMHGTAILKKNLGKQDLCRKIMDKLASYRFLKNSFVHVTYVGKRFLVEGRVRNIIQREFALLAVAGFARSVAVGNRLRILKT